MAFRNSRLRQAQSILEEMKQNSTNGYVHELALAAILGMPTNKTKSPVALMYTLFKQIKKFTDSSFIVDSNQYNSSGVRYTKHGSTETYTLGNYNATTGRIPRWFQFRQEVKHTIQDQVDLQRDLRDLENLPQYGGEDLQHQRWKFFYEVVKKHWPLLRSVESTMSLIEVGVMERILESSATSICELVNISRLERTFERVAESAATAVLRSSPVSVSRVICDVCIPLGMIGGRELRVSTTMYMLFQ